MMEILDDKLDFGDNQLTLDKLEAKIKVKKEFVIAMKHFQYARVAAIIVTVLTIITLMITASSGMSDRVGLVEVVLVILYLISIFVPLEYSKYSFSIISFLYFVNLILAIFSYTGGILILVILLRLVIFYFLARGAYSGFSVDDILRQMKSLNMKTTTD